MGVRNQRRARSLKIERYLRQSAAEMEARLNEGQTLDDLAGASPHIHASTRSRAAGGNACSPLVRHAMLLLSKRRCGASREELLEPVEWHRGVVDVICGTEDQDEDPWGTEAEADSRQDVVARIIWQDGTVDLGEYRELREALLEEISAKQALLSHVNDRIAEQEVGS